MFADNNIFHHGARELVLRTVKMTSPRPDALRLYNFLLSDGFNGNDWDSDLFYLFTYIKKYGVVRKNHWSKDMNPNLYFKEILIENDGIK